MRRRFGILLHPTSLPGRYGLGDLGPGADRFLGWMREAGASVWQVLPLGPCGYGGSPYAAASAFAGNRYLISPDRLVAERWLEPGDLSEKDDDDVSGFRDRLLDLAWRRLRGSPPKDRDAFEEFRRDPGRAPWLADWAMYTALKAEQGGESWTRWPEPLARRDPSALAEAARRLSAAVEREEFVQFLFFSQWEEIRRRADELSIAILGDMPIYVDHDSADVWAHRELFDLDERGEPLFVSGVPPDYFSATGQRWGSPLFRWDRCRAEGWRWWIERFRANLRLADLVRVDHFRGFAGYWAIPASEPTAIGGEWRPGPGRELFDAVRGAAGRLPVVAEDLGVITDDVVALRDGLGLPGMRVLQFGFAADDSPHLPHRHVPNCLAYTGTHDNDTARGWLEHAPPAERARALEYTGGDAADFAWSLLRATLASVAETAIAPLQDVLGLGSEARLNTPGNAAGNWRWQAEADAFPAELAGRLRRLCSLTGRAR